MRICFESIYLHPALAIMLFKIPGKISIMESYWCEKKNSIMDLMNGKERPIALTPCLKSECEQWRGGEFIQIRKAGNPNVPRSSTDNHRFFKFPDLKLVLDRRGLVLIVRYGTS
jgi:hypothetical protein